MVSQQKLKSSWYRDKLYDFLSIEIDSLESRGDPESEVIRELLNELRTRNEDAIEEVGEQLEGAADYIKYLEMAQSYLVDDSEDDEERSLCVRLQTNGTDLISD